MLSTSIRTLLALVATFLVSTAALANDELDYGPPPAPKRLAPKVEVPDADWSWGKILKGEKITHDFTIKNTGEAPLRLNQVKASCGCTTVDWTRVIEPGQTGKVTLEMNTQKLRTSKVRKYATISCNDPASPQVKVWMGGELIDVISHEPQAVNLSGIAGGVLQGTVKIKPGAGSPIEVKKVIAKQRYLEVLSTKEIEKGQLYEVAIQATPSERVARFRDNLEVTVVTADGETRTSLIPVSIDHRDRITITPRGNIVFARRDTQSLREDGSKPLRKDILVTSGSPGVNFNVTGISVEDAPEGLFSAELTTLQEGSRYKITVTLNRYSEQRFVRGRLVLTTDDEQANTRDVRIFAQFGNAVSRPAPRAGTQKPNPPHGHPGHRHTPGDEKKKTPQKQGSGQ